MMVLREPPFHPFYLPWILDYEWDDAYATYCFCSNKLLRKYHHIVRIRQLKSSSAPGKTPKHRLQRPPKPRLRRAPKSSRHRFKTPRQLKHQFSNLRPPVIDDNNILHTSPSFDPFMQYYGSVKDILDEYGESTECVTPEEIYAQDPLFFDQHLDLLAYLFVDNDTASVDTDYSHDDIATPLTPNEVDSDNKPTINAMFENCTFIEGVHPNPNYISSEDNHFHISTSSSVPFSAASSVCNDADSASNYYNNHDDNNNHYSQSYSPEPSEHEQSAIDYDDDNGDDDDYDGYYS